MSPITSILCTRDKEVLYCARGTKEFYTVHEGQRSGNRKGVNVHVYWLEASIHTYDNVVMISCVDLES